MEDNEIGYYKILGIEKTTDRAIIWKAFREIGNKYLPDETADNLSQNSIMFSKVCEAYEVLSTPELKEIYDTFGESILKNGMPIGTKHPGYAFNGDCYGKALSSIK